MWEGIFEYDPSLASCLRRVEPAYFGKGHKAVKLMNKEVGQLVFRDEKPVHWRVKYKKKTYMVHRIVYEIHYGTISDGFAIDHINRDPSDNRIENLRAVPYVLNSRNRKKLQNNKSGETGVHLYKDKKWYYYIATWRENGKEMKKYFSVFEYGYEKAKELATEFRKSKILELNSLGYGYTEAHGS